MTASTATTSSASVPLALIRALSAGSPPMRARMFRCRRSLVRHLVQLVHPMQVWTRKAS